jgi:anaerobic magnesium-protoporphyrin IX monomethyl ester cyclase
MDDDGRMKVPGAEGRPSQEAPDVSAARAPELLRRRKKVVLVRPSYSGIYKLFGRVPDDREVRPPLGLLSIAGSLRHAGHDVEVIDAEPHLLDTDEIVREVARREPDFLGVTSTTPEFSLTQEIVRQAKAARPGLVTVLGGAHASALPESCLDETPGLDYVVVGEGEQAMIDLVENRPRDRVLRPEPVKDLDALPLPARDLVDPRDYRFASPQEGLVTTDAVEASRGCPFSCSFCFHLAGQPTRFKSAERVVEELAQSRRTTKAQLVIFFDDTFTLDRRHVKKLLGRIVESRLGQKFHCFTRADTMSQEVVELMAKAGFVKATMGVESGSQEVLDRLQKGTKLEDYRRAFRWLHAAGIETRGSFIVGVPHETWHTVKASIDFARSLDLFRIGVNIATPYPGTRLHEQARRKEGIELLQTDWRHFCRWGHSVVRTPAMEAAEIEEAQRIFLAEFYSSPRVVRYHARRFLGGNHSLYYYRPVMWSVWRRLNGVSIRSKLR